MISNYIHYKVYAEITYSVLPLMFGNKCVCDYIPHLVVMWLFNHAGNPVHVSEKGPFKMYIDGNVLSL